MYSKTLDMHARGPLQNQKFEILIVLAVHLTPVLNNINGSGTARYEKLIIRYIV